MLAAAWGNPVGRELYGAQKFECARNLQAKKLVRIVGSSFELTVVGERVAQELLDKGSNKIED
jgi:hypothetical protein